MNTQELLESKNIPYRIQGADLIISCLNPAHEDNSPSLHVDSLTGNCNCFPCGFAGNVFKHFNITRNQMDMRVIALQKKIREMNVTKLSVPLGAEVFNKDYRGIKGSTFEHFGAFTYSADKDLEDRVVFPILDIGGEIISFQARRIYSEVKPKYLNYPPHTNKGFFPAVPDQEMGSIILVEGLFDMLNLYDKGLTNAVASMGLAVPKKRDFEGLDILERFSLLKLQGISTIYIMYDGDDAGQQAANKLLPILNKEFIADTIELPDGLDPGAMTQGQVTELRNQLYENSDNRQE
jgi:DNA primase